MTRRSLFSLVAVVLLALLLVVGGVLAAGEKPEYRIDIRSVPIPVVFDVPAGRTPVLVVHTENVRIEVKGRRIEVASK